MLARYFLLLFIVYMHSISMTKEEVGQDIDVKKEVGRLLNSMKFVADFQEVYTDKSKSHGNILCDLQDKKIRISYDDYKIIILDRNRVKVLSDGNLNTARAKDTPMRLLMLDNTNIVKVKKLKQNYYRCDIQDKKYYLQLLYDRKINKITMIYSPAEDCLIKFCNFVDLSEKYNKRDLFFISSKKKSNTRAYKTRKEILSIVS